ncbi:acyl carrier protein [Aerococcus sanguinicola]|uniref:acyl carrier protein n=1 Tax=unclassified Aerococcus TaxID=2618060 RepID=UPI0008A2513A|nr:MULTISPECIES: acyl carrier protein [unclassified Aerococcus]KAB0647684.1 acyl carrier protein [Aerococcus sanguinicola]MDK6233076.1 acyl carrier protein [Aerococcus sp. UMB10185]MDK6804479.1 acyl carrier protein [Aerococcus sp. UMB7834]MDK6855372.1 acyl carrier protein [Aerococcus sp. UMB7533]MDK8502949.1 acyl carrier protein [Aerococcus sp. UMB1112A]
MEVELKVFQMIIDRYGVEAERVSRDLSFTDDLGADSLDVVELIMELEDIFGIQIPDDEVESIETVGDVLDYIRDNVPSAEDKA